MLDEATAREGVLALLDGRSAQFAHKPALCMRQSSGWTEITYAELSQGARLLASCLMEMGVERGDRVAILSEPRPEWGVAVFASIRAGAVIVPLDSKLGPGELTPLLLDSQPRVLFASARCASTARALQQGIPSLELIAILGSAEGEGFPSIWSLRPREMLPSRDRSFDEVALITYTSGTTGSPKGVMTSFGSLLFEVEALKGTLQCSSTDVFLSILPLNHLLELTGGFLSVLNVGGTVCYADSLYPHDLLEAMRQRRVTAVVGVPLFFTVLRNSIERQAAEHIWSRLYLSLASTVARLLPSHRIRRVVFFGVHRQFGWRLRALGSGGAALDPSVARFFDRMGLPLLQGYGLTETSPVVSTNTLHANRIGSVGRPLAGVEVRIESDELGEEGEVLTRGPHVMKGYYRRPDLTAEAIDEDGWFHTGDLGRLDADGFLYLTGRLKDVIVLPGGKKVYPEEVEATLARAPGVKEVCVLARRKLEPGLGRMEEVCAVVVPRTEDSAHASADVLVEEVRRAASGLAPYKRPTTIFVHPGTLPRTAIGKVKRSLVLEWIGSQEVVATWS